MTDILYASSRQRAIEASRIADSSSRDATSQALAYPSPAHVSSGGIDEGSVDGAGQSNQSRRDAHQFWTALGLNDGLGSSQKKRQTRGPASKKSNKRHKANSYPAPALSRSVMQSHPQPQKEMEDAERDTTTPNHRSQEAVSADEQMARDLQDEWNREFEVPPRKIATRWNQTTLSGFARGSEEGGLLSDEELARRLQHEWNNESAVRRRG